MDIAYTPTTQPQLLNTRVSHVSYMQLAWFAPRSGGFFTQNVNLQFYVDHLKKIS